MTNLKQEKKQNLTNKVLKFSIVLFVLSLGCKVYCSNLLAVKNSDLRNTFLQRENLEKEISSLTYTDSQLSCIHIVEQKAYELGFVPMQESLLSLNVSSANQVAALTQQ